MSNVIETLRERGLLQDMTDPEFEKACSYGKVIVYAGFDPTADSLHIGHLISVLILKHFQLAGHQPIAVVGGATGMVGDPSGRSSERNLLSAEDLAKNVAGLRENLGRFLSFEGEHKALLLNNADWIGPYTFLEFLRDVGKHFRLSDMLAKESVKRRLESESGISFTEFAYQLLQAYDFLHLFRAHGCNAQVGGSDQWGNITAGTDLIRKLEQGRAFGMTTPLLTNAQGEKMGKTAGGAVWLDPRKFTPYQFYQFFIQREDAEVEKLLKMLTFLPLKEIAAVLAEHEKDPSQRVAQRRLAWEITAMVHGEEEAQRAREASEALFGGQLMNRSDAEIRQIFSDVPSIQVPRAQLQEGLRLAELLVEGKLVPSKKEANRLHQQGGVYLNNGDVALPAEKRTLTEEDLASETLLILRAGKKKYCLVQFV